MRLDSDEARARFGAARVLRLATADVTGAPHLVPCTFVIDSVGRIASGVDGKPKTTPDLRRLRNIERDPRVSLLADEYAEDWTRLWWVRADGRAMIEYDGAEHPAHWRLLREKYRQYRSQTLTGPVMVVTVTKWSGWAYSPAGGSR